MKSAHPPIVIEDVTIFDVKLPTQPMRTAWRLRHAQGLKDEDVAKALSISRGQANRRINEFQRRLNMVRAFCAEHGDNTLVNQLLA